MKFFNTNISKDQSRDTGMAIVLVLLIVGWSRKQDSLMLAAVAVHVLNMTAPQLFRPFAIVWLGLSHAMGTVVSKVLLSTVFILVVTPFGVVRKFMGKDPLKLRAFKAATGSAMLERDHVFVAQDMEKPY